MCNVYLNAPTILAQTRPSPLTLTIFLQRHSLTRSCRFVSFPSTRALTDPTISSFPRHALAFNRHAIDVPRDLPHSTRGDAPRRIIIINKPSLPLASRAVRAWPRPRRPDHRESVAWSRPSIPPFLRTSTNNNDSASLALSALSVSSTHQPHQHTQRIEHRPPREPALGIMGDEQMMDTRFVAFLSRRCGLPCWAAHTTLWDTRR